ncbi:MAG: FkbM family methyltransferase [Microcoleaceae cyanobacterium]
MKVEDCCQALLAQILPTVDPHRQGMCIDVGVGTFAFYCELFAQLGFKTVAVEPLPLPAIRAMCQSHGIEWVESCLSDVDGTQTLHLGTYQGAVDVNLSSLVAHWWGASTMTQTVRSLRLPTLLSQVQAEKITCIKLDVEGVELTILKQFMSLPESLLPQVVMFEYGGGDSRDSGQKGWSEEFLSKTHACLKVLQQCGYGFSIGVDSAANTTEVLFDIRYPTLQLDNILHPQAIYGNIISFRDCKFSKFRIQEICREFYEPPELSITYSDKKLIESGEFKVIQKCIDSHQVVFDVGANIGAWSQAVLKHCPTAKLHLFEPVSPTYQQLLKNCAYRMQAGNMSFNNIALSHQESLQKFCFYPDRPRWSTFYRRSDIEAQHKLSSPQIIPVLQTTLDLYCQRHSINRIHFLKIDVEGSEFNVLQGATDLLKRGKIDYLQFEYGGTYKDAQITLKQVFHFLSNFKYLIFKIHPNRLEYIPRFIPSSEDFEYSNFLAVNQRLKANIFNELPQMLDLPQLFKQHSIQPKGVIHVGAYEGQDLQLYQQLELQKTLLIEANPIVFKRLARAVEQEKNVIAVNCAISDYNGTATLHITSLEQSSSILPLKQVSQYYPQIQETEQISVPARNIDSLLQELKLNPQNFNLLNIDIQGAELLALKGAQNWLKHVEAINTEVNYEELYEGCVLIDQLDDFLNQHGFERVATTSPYHPSWGDAFYIKKPVITMSSLGKNGRFANQVFQYAFLKIYAQEHDLKLETPQWIGQALFGHQDSRITQQYPEFKEETNILSEAKILQLNSPLKNRDLWGYFQYHTQYYKPHRKYFRSLFKPTREIKQKLAPALQRLQAEGKTIVGLHLRRGDYGYEHFFVAPNSWYKEWLKGLWETLDNPVLFIASDEPAKVVHDFSEYQPLTAQDLGADLPQARFYPDFYLLSHCNIMAISNSSFSFTASLLNEKCKFFFRPHLPSKKLIPFDPWNSEVIFRDAKVDHFEKPLPISISACYEMIKKQPDSVEAYQRLAKILQHQGNLEAAIRAYQKVIELRPQDPETYANIGGILDQQEQPEAAINYYRKAMALQFPQSFNSLS